MDISSSRTPRLLGLLAAVAVLGSALAVTPASAAPVKPGGAGAMQGHCVINLKPGVNKVVNLKPGVDKAPALHCFGTFTKAISYATGGAVTDAPAKATNSAALRAKLKAANVAAQQAAAPLVIGVEYGDRGYGGWSLTMSAATSCTATITDTDYSLELPNVIYDQISSFTNEANCYTDHFYFANFGFPHTGFHNDKLDMPLMNQDGGPLSGDNNTRSITWS